MVDKLVYFRFQMADVGGRVGGFGGEDLVDEENHYLATADRSIVVPHTPEREAFLAKCVHNLEEAALQLDKFCDTVKKDPLAIDTLIHKGMLLTYVDEESPS